MKGQDLYDSEYVDKEAFFDLAAQTFYTRILEHRAAKASEHGLFQDQAEEDYAFDKIQEFDFDMDLPSIIYGVWGEFQKAEAA